MNARRLPWPRMQYGKRSPKQGQPTEGYLEYTRDLGICYDLVKLASDLLDRKLKLIAGGPKQGIVQAATDGKNIYLPKMHPCRRVATKHELSHIFFKSDIALRLAFVEHILDEMEKDLNKKLSAAHPLVP